ncbi:MAG: hypothetical protein LBS18_05275 [Clostridiales bacterium]|jgi:23S rRNA pseudouridine1911/1915/1917 synthase|nr:hypothetical protein [Clostridiales bacterium]
MYPTIFYEDNHLLVVEKPPNIPTQADESGDMDLLTLLKRYIREKYHKPGAVYLGLCHRLDRPVGGVMVFARTSKAAARLTAQFKGREAEKRYAAVVQGTPPYAAKWCDYIDPTSEQKRVRIAHASFGNAREARLNYQVIGTANDRSLLSIGLLTGRKHQIRAQCACHGYPIIGDQRYNDHAKKEQIALWAYALSILHPTTKQRMDFFSPPQGAAFSAFFMTVQGLPAYRYCDVLYCDALVLAVSKQAGIEVATADAGALSLQRHLEQIYGALYPVHRLDANTRGVVLFARNERACVNLEKALRHEQTKKYYHCVVRGKMPLDAGILRGWAVKNPDVAYLYVCNRPVDNALPIQTGYRTLAHRDGFSLLEITLYTGRTHQIRAHMAAAGYPLLGDDKYGDRQTNKAMHIHRQALLAQRIALFVPAEMPSLAYLSGREFKTYMTLALPDAF